MELPKVTVDNLLKETKNMTGADQAAEVAMNSVRNSRGTEHGKLEIITGIWNSDLTLEQKLLTLFNSGIAMTVADIKSSQGY
jgi:hypothetical protein